MGILENLGAWFVRRGFWWPPVIDLPPEGLSIPLTSGPVPLVGVSVEGADREPAILDTGSAVSILHGSHPHAARHRPRRFGAMTLHGLGVPVREAGVVALREIRLEGVRAAPALFSVLDAAALGEEAPRVLLGLDLFHDSALLFEGGGTRLTIRSPGPFRREASASRGEWESVALGTGTGFLPTFTVPASADGSGSWPMLLDTGAESSTLPGGLIRKLGLEPVGTWSATGVGGREESDLFDPPPLRCGPAEVRLSACGTCTEESGILGWDVLGKLDFALDIPGRTMWFRVRPAPARGAGPLR